MKEQKGMYIAIVLLLPGKKCNVLSREVFFKHHDLLRENMSIKTKLNKFEFRTNK